MGATSSAAVRAAYLIATALIVVLIMMSVLDAAKGGPLIPEPATDDFARFHAAAQLVAEGNAAGAYEPTILAARVGENTGFLDKEPLALGHPPFLVLYFLPLAPISFEFAYAVFLVAGFIVLVRMLTLLGLDRAWAAVGLLLLTVPGYATIEYGQLGFWASAGLIGVFLSLRAGRPFVAGLLLAALAFKPAYVLGVGLWWLLEPRRNARALAGAASGALVLFALGLAVPNAWSSFREVLGGTPGDFVVGVALSGRSLLEMLLAIMPSAVLATAMWFAIGAGVAVAFRSAAIRFENMLEPAFSLAVVVGLLLAPRTGWYDWVLLVVPAAIMWQAYPTISNRLAAAGAWLIVTALASRTLVLLAEAATGIYLQVAPLVLATVTWWVARAVADVGVEQSATVG